VFVRYFGLLTLAAVLLGCADAGGEGDADGTDLQYEVELRWTSFGIPHVKADDWGSLGYGFAYATATDAVCVIAKDVQMVNGNLAATCKVIFFTKPFLLTQNSPTTMRNKANVRS
jgi:acyl-homoserine-lactone acylase